MSWTVIRVSGKVQRFDALPLEPDYDGAVACLALQVPGVGMTRLALKNLPKQHLRLLQLTLSLQLRSLLHRLWNGRT